MTKYPNSLEESLRLYYENPSDFPLGLYSYLSNLVVYYVRKVYHSDAWMFTDTGIWSEEEIEDIFGDFIKKLLKESNGRSNALINCYVSFVSPDDENIINMQQVKNYICKALETIFKDRHKKRYPGYFACRDKVANVLTTDQDFSFFEIKEGVFWKLSSWEESIDILFDEYRVDWLNKFVIPELGKMKSAKNEAVKTSVTKVFIKVEEKKKKPHAMIFHDIVNVVSRIWPYDPVVTIPTDFFERESSDDEDGEQGKGGSIDSETSNNAYYDDISEEIYSDIINIEENAQMSYWHYGIKEDKKVVAISLERGVTENAIYSEISSVSELIKNKCDKYNLSKNERIEVYNRICKKWIEDFKKKGKQ